MAELLRESFHGVDPADFMPGASKSDAGTAVEFYFNEVAQKDYCRMHFPGDRQKIWDQPVRNQDKMRFQAQWKLYSEGKDQLHGQTLLKTWKKIDDGSVNLYAAMLHIQTVEQLAAFPDSNMINVPNSNRQLILRHREMAQAFMEEKRQSVGYDQALSAAEQSQTVATQALEENRELRAQLDELSARIAKGPAVEAQALGVYPFHTGGVGRGAKYKLSDGTEVQGKKAAIEAQEGLNRELAADRPEGG